KVSGIQSIADEQLEIAYPPEPVLERFTQRFGMPDGIQAKMGSRQTLVLEGDATHSWLAKVRAGAKDTPGIREIDDQKVTDLDLQTFKETKAIIESAFVYVLVDKDNFATEGFAALSLLPDQVRRCLGAAKRLGYTAIIEIHGFADASGASDKNQDLSQRRAAAVQKFLVGCGFEPQTFRVMGLGAEAAAGEAIPEQADRRVAFKVILGTGPAAP
ncbi:MAG: OmpA family protein, partial [Chthoniobacterales bacterium]